MTPASGPVVPSAALPCPDAVVLKGVREEPTPDDGLRVLVDRLWPRGVSKHQAVLGAPDPDLP